MKSVLDKSTRDELIRRINLLNDNSTALWGNMNTFQMLRHCILADSMYLGKTKYKQVFLGRLFGKMALKGMLKDEKPLKKNEPTSPAFIITETDGNIEIEKRNWINLIDEYENLNAHDFIHFFFGKMTKKEIGQFAYKHIDHHLRQFNS
jgi:hypothetical protein